MTIWNKSLSSYIRFAAPVALLILLVGILRLTLSLAGQPDSSTHWLSMTAIMFFGVVYLGIRVGTSGLGSYKHLLAVIAVPNTALHAVAIAGIVIGILTGHDNVFTAPEYAFGGNGRTWTHAASHATLGLVAGGVVNWIVACLFLFLARLFGGRKARAASRA
ncbi:MAG TPA: hypothetical protein VFY29_05620 [Terriglobia bacterium]|nr:hypothetical protein [Terriglobia bacterium]